MAQTPDELDLIYRKLMERTPVRPVPAPNSGRSVSSFTDLLEKSFTSEIEARMGADLDAFVLKL